MSDDIPVSPEFQPAPGVKYEDEQVETPAEATASEPTPETPVNPEPTAPVVEEPAKPEAVAEPVERPKKAGPIAKLLEDRYTLETENAELKRKLEEASTLPASPQATADVKQLAEKY